MDEGELEEIEVNVGGEVTSDSTGDPIEGANISAFRIDKDELVGESSTGTDGSYSISFTVAEDNTPDELRLEVNAGGFMEKKVTVGFSAEISRNFGLELVTTESTASGKVTRANSDDPIEGATVTGKRVQNNEQLFEVTTDSDGTYESTFKVADDPNEIIITADAEDFDSNDRTVDFGSSIAVDFSLNPSELSVTLSGTVKAELDGSTVEGADISVLRPGETESLASTASEAAGTYDLSFTVLALDAPSELRIETEDRRFDDASLTVEFSESVTQDIDLPSIEISTVQELQAIQTDSDFPLDGFYVQTADIEASETANQNGGNGFQPIGDDVVPFSGVYDGDGFAIQSLTINRPDESPVGLFGKVASDGLLQNVFLQNVSVEGNDNTGGLAGENKGEIQNSSVTGNVVGVTGSERAYSLGGVAGLNVGKVVSSEADVSLTIRASEPFNLIGGLVGRNEGEIRDSEASGSVEAENVVGGLVGFNDLGSEISNSVAIGNVSGAYSTGGLVGGNDGDVQGSTAEGDVEGTSDVGGLIGGTDSGTVEGSVATGDVNGDTRVGGVAGKNDSVIRSSKATGRVEGNNKIGGLVGGNLGLVEESVAIGNVSGSDLVGGLIGVNNEGEVHFSVAEGAVTGVSKVGGLVGSNSIVADASTGSVVSSSYATGDVSGDDQVGALVGVNTDDSNVDVSFAAGSVSGNEDVGGLIGVNGANVSGSYWDTEATSQNDGVGRGPSSGTTGLTTDEMQGESAEKNMDSFDFMDTWQIVMGDYPALQWEK
jgi:hypothetical protein